MLKDLQEIGFQLQNRNKPGRMLIEEEETRYEIEIEKEK